MLITYQNLKIRNAEQADCELLCRWWNDGAVMAHAGFPNGLGTTVEAIATQISSDTDDIRRRLILLVEDRRVGEMSYTNCGNGIAEIGIKICESTLQEKGYGSLFLKMLIGNLFERGYHKIVLDTNLENTRAQHVYEKLGFRKLRIRENCWQDQLGKWQTAVDYELTANQFTPLT